LDICINDEGGDELIERSFEIDRDEAATMIAAKMQR
jgi:hypothetical protein